MSTADELLAELEDARKRRSRLLAWFRRRGREHGEKRIINQSVSLIKKTIKRIKRELRALGVEVSDGPERPDER